MEPLSERFCRLKGRRLEWLRRVKVLNHDRDLLMSSKDGNICNLNNSS